MKQNEIMALINAKIAGQGSAVDIGGALPVILSALASAAVPIEVADITGLTDDQLDSLNVGDKVAKKTGTAQHLYVVTYKDAENGGLCLTYIDASVVETVSYDHTESGWAYNSTDVTPISSGGGGGLAPMIVHGSIPSLGNGLFTPGEGQPSWDEAYGHFAAGGIVLLTGTTVDANIPFAESVTAYGVDEEDSSEFLSSYNGWWPKPAGE